MASPDAGVCIVLAVVRLNHRMGDERQVALLLL
jgi:hypothetical protein